MFSRISKSIKSILSADEKSINALLTGFLRRINLSIIAIRLFQRVLQSRSKDNSLPFSSFTYFWRTEFFTGDLLKIRTILRTLEIISSIHFLTNGVGMLSSISPFKGVWVNLLLTTRVDSMLLRILNQNTI